MTNRARRNIAPIKREPVNTDKISVIIPADAAGHRMKYVGAKALIELPNGQSVLERQVTIIRQIYPQADIIVCIGFEHEKIIRKYRNNLGIRFVYNPQHEDTGVVHGLHLAMYATTSNNILVIYGDLVFNLQAIAGIVSDKSRILVSSTINNEVGMIVDRGIVTNFAQDLPTKWGHIAYFTGKESNLFMKAIMNPLHLKWLGYEILNYIIENGGVLHAFQPVDAQIKEINTTKDIE